MTDRPSSSNLRFPRRAGRPGLERRLGEGPYLTGSPYPPIAEYAFLSDCRFTCLVAPDGNVEWLCLPRPHDPSLFGAMLDRAAGGYRVGPTDSTAPVGRRYLPGTNVLETTWQTDTGWLVVTDFLSIGPWHHEGRRSPTQHRPPTDHEPDNALVRLVRCIHGTVEVELVCEPAFDYGRSDASWSYNDDGYGDASASSSGTTPTLRLRTNLRLGLEGRRAEARTTMREGDEAFATLSWLDDDRAPATLESANNGLLSTAEYWRGWLSRGAFPDHPWRSYLQRSALALKGLTYAPTGALLAAATTSLPETPQGGRNWDYRYTWVRDATFALWGLYTLGFDAEADAFFYFLADVWERDASVQVMYAVDGTKDLEEVELSHLAGYEGARPVRIGNDAYKQSQHDLWGVILDSLYLHARARSLPERLWPVLVRQVEAALEHWRQPDRGMWEVRGEPQHFTSSKLLCWVAADRGARLALARQDHALHDRWRAAAAEIKEDICQNGIGPKGVFTQYYGGTTLDASLLLVPLFRFLPAEDERVRNTVLAIADELSVDGLVLRYRVAETDDGLFGEEGTFTICSFWLVSALVEIGEQQRAQVLCERLLRSSSPLLLYAEELEAHTGRHLGNFPQAFTHLALINAVVHVLRAEREC